MIWRKSYIPVFLRPSVAKVRLGELDLCAGVEEKGVERNENYVKFSILVSFLVSG